MTENEKDEKKETSSEVEESKETKTEKEEHKCSECDKDAEHQDKESKKFYCDDHWEELEKEPEGKEPEAEKTAE